MDAPPDDNEATVAPGSHPAADEDNHSPPANGGNDAKQETTTNQTTPDRNGDDDDPLRHLSVRQQTPPPAVLSPEMAAEVRRAELERAIASLTDNLNQATLKAAMAPQKVQEGNRKDRLQPGSRVRGLSPFAGFQERNRGSGLLSPTTSIDGGGGSPTLTASSPQFSSSRRRLLPPIMAARSMDSIAPLAAGVSETMRTAPLNDVRFGLGTGHDNQATLENDIQMKQIALADALEEQKLVAARHKEVRAQFDRVCQDLADREEEEVTHRKAMASLKARFKAAKHERQAAERRVEATHTRVHDLKIQLQKSRLKRSDEEEAAQLEFDRLRAELQQIEETITREEREHAMQIEAQKARIKQLEVDIKLFVPEKYVEQEELRELETLMRLKNIGERNEGKEGVHGPGVGYASNVHNPLSSKPQSPAKMERAGTQQSLRSPTENRVGSPTMTDFAGTLNSRLSRNTAQQEMEAEIQRRKLAMSSQRDQAKAKLDSFLGK